MSDDGACGARQMSTFCGQLFKAMQSVGRSTLVLVRLSIEEEDGEGATRRRKKQRRHNSTVVLCARCSRGVTVRAGAAGGGVLLSQREQQREEQKEEEGEEEGECQCCVLSRAFHRPSPHPGPIPSLTREASHGTTKLRPLPLCAPRRLSLFFEKKMFMSFFSCCLSSAAVAVRFISFRSW